MDQWEIDRRAREERTDQLAGELSSWINGASDEDIEQLASAILRDHRTLQQKTFGFMLQTIYKWAGLEENRFDLRNAYTVEKCQAIKELLGTYGSKPPCI